MLITDLTEDTILLILEHLPLITQLRVASLVCSHWNLLVDYLCRTRHKLVLQPEQFSGKLQIQSTIAGRIHLSDNLICPELCLLTRQGAAAIRFIQRKFPAIQNFVYIHHYLLVHELLILLDKWSTQLTRLTISVATNTGNDIILTHTYHLDWDTVLRFMHRLPRLRSLKIYAGLAYTRFKHDIPNLPQLDTLYFGLPVANVKQTEALINRSWNSLSKFGFVEAFDWHSET